MMTDPSQSFVEILKIVGHSEEEAKKLNEDFSTMVLQRSVLLLSSKLSQEKSNVLKKMMESGEKGQEIINFVIKERGEEEVSKMIMGSTILLTEEYMKKVGPKLPEDIKKRLAEFIINFQ